MGLEKIEVISQIMVDENGSVNVRKSTRIIDTDTGLSVTPDSYHRGVLAPGDDNTAHPDLVKAICAAAWTPEILSKWQAKRDATAQIEAAKAEKIEESAVQK